MANPTLKKEEIEEKEDRTTVYVREECLASHNSSDDKDILDSFQSLEVDEARLTEQKERLTALLNQLELKAKEEVEKRKRKVKRLNSEVSDLKRRVEKFTIWINSESTHGV